MPKTRQHFRRVSTVYDDVRITDKEPVEQILGMVPRRLVRGADIACGTGRYTKLIHSGLASGSATLALDLSAEMLRVLHEDPTIPGTISPLRASAGQLPIRAASLDWISVFNAIHHLDLEVFLASARESLVDAGLLFVYTRTPEMNARTIWGLHFPGFNERETRLFTEQQLRDAIGPMSGLRIVDWRCLRYSRIAGAAELRARVRSLNYSTFSLYSPVELEFALEEFLARLPDDPVEWVDENLLVACEKIGPARP